MSSSSINESCYLFFKDRPLPTRAEALVAALAGRRPKPRSPVYGDAVLTEGARSNASSTHTLSSQAPPRSVAISRLSPPGGAAPSPHRLFDPS